jgi:hypothetical protein
MLSLNVKSIARICPLKGSEEVLVNKKTRDEQLVVEIPPASSSSGSRAPKDASKKTFKLCKVFKPEGKFLSLIFRVSF